MITRPSLWRLMAILGLCVLVLGQITPTQAYSGAFFHTVSRGSRGTDVAVVQWLLNISADGDFGPNTDAAVRSFQSSHNLTVDGVVGNNTWNALIVTVRRGSQGNAVKAVQSALNAKLHSGLTVDGDFGGGTEAAVKAFQQHAGISADGVVGPTTWKNLIWHYEYPDMSANLCDQDPAGNGTANWGVAATIAQLEQATRSFAARGYGQVPLGDIGFEHGGNIPDHNAHEKGVDVDIWPIRTDRAQCSAGRITWQSSTYDRAATRELVKAIRAAAPGHVDIIFFNDPVLISEGLTTKLQNHDNHLHVRYR
jgi:peptidoglycan hydrolase-like protein with peptidoglycan-binding domain